MAVDWTEEILPEEMENAEDAGKKYWQLNLPTAVIPG